MTAKFSFPRLPLIAAFLAAAPVAHAGLAGYWNFDEGAGATAHDYTVNDNEGTLTAIAGGGSVPVWVAGHTAAPSDHALQFSQGNVQIQTGASDTVTCDFSPGMGYRLPTEAEWEKAARGWSAGKRFPGGDAISHDQANHYATTSHGYDLGPTDGFHPSYDDGVPPHTAPAGTFAPNGYGLQDMAGNVFEW